MAAKRRKRKVKSDGLRKLCVCSDTQWDGCPHPWHFRIKFSGQPKRHRINLQDYFKVPGVISRDDARALADRARVALRTPDTNDPRLTLTDVCDRFEKAHAGKTYHYLKSLRTIEVRAANGSTVPLGQKPIADVTADDIEQVADACQARARKGPRNGLDAKRHLLTTARKLFRWSIKQKIVRSTPFVFEGVPMITVPTSRQRQRRLVGDEEARLLEAADPFTKDRIVAALELGGRGGELLRIHWSDVREHTIVVTTKKTRDGQPKHIELPISPTLRKLLDRRRKGPDGTDLPDTALVFGNEVGEPVPRRIAHGLWDETRERAGIPKDADGRFTLRFHDLRREFGSQLLEAGASLHEVRDALGHSNVGMTSTYLSTTAESLKTPFKKLEASRRRKALRVVSR